MKKIFLLFIITSSIALSQSYQLIGEIGEFNQASSFYIAANGFIYVTDTGNDEIYMLDTLGNLKKTFGGYGWNDNSLDDPMDVFADPLTVYVADKNNNRIKRFDRDLNYLSSLYTKDSDNPQERFAYPVSCATSNFGDLYLIDSENIRVLKFDIFGNYLLEFGGFDAGTFMLSNPLQLAIASNNNVFVIDENKIIVFDQYGNGISKINLDEKLNSIRILFDNLTVTTNNNIYYTNLSLPNEPLTAIRLYGVDEMPKIVSSIIFNNKLYVLTSSKILIFNKIGNN